MHTNVNITPEKVALKILERVQTELLETERPLTPEDDLFEAGLDSMAIMQLTLLVEEEFGVRLPEALITRETFKTAQKLALVICEIKKPSA